MNYKERVILV